MLPLKKLDTTLVVLVVVGLLANVAAWYCTYSDPVSGIFYYRAHLIPSEGEAPNLFSRVNFSDDELFEFQKSPVAAWSRSASRKMVDAGGGNYVFKTVSASADRVETLLPTNVDDDVAFYQAYFSRLGGEYTFVRVHSQANGYCFYIKEISRVRCFGHED